MKTIAKVLFLCLVMTGVAQAQLQNYLRKTHRQLAGNPTSSTRVDTLIFTNYVVTDSVIYALERRGLTPYDYGNSPTSIADIIADTNLVLIPNGVFQLDNTLYLGDGLSAKISGVFPANTRNSPSYENRRFKSAGSRIYANIDDGTPAIWDSAQASIIEGIALYSDTLLNSGDGILVKRKIQSTTIGNVQIRHNMIGDFGGHGIRYVGPDNGAWIGFNQITRSGASAIRIRSAETPPNHGLNPIVIGNRAITNDGGSFHWSGVEAGLIAGNGFLGAGIDTANVRIEETAGGGSSAANVFLSNDIENNINGRDTTKAVVQMRGTRSNVWMGNFFFPRQNDGASSPYIFDFTNNNRDLIFIGNNFSRAAADTVMVSSAGNTDVLFLGENNGILANRDYKPKGGNIRWMQVSTIFDSSFSIVDSRHDLQIMPSARDDVHFFKWSYESGLRPTIYTYGFASGAWDTTFSLSTNAFGGANLTALRDDLNLESINADVVINPNQRANNTIIAAPNRKNALRVNPAGFVGIDTSVPRHLLSMYSDTAAFCMTDVSKNLVTTNTTEAADTAAILLVATSATSPQIRITNTTGDTVFFLAANEAVRIGTPAGGLKGAGSLNAEAVYDDDTLLSDSEFAQAFEVEIEPVARMAEPIPYLDFEKTREFVEKSLHLPTMPGRKEWVERGETISLGEMATRLWQTVERQHLHMAEMADKIARLERKLQQLESER